MKLQTKAIVSDLKEVSQTTSTVTFGGYASVKNTVDDHGETIVGDNVYDLSRYMLNPVVFVDHCYDVNCLVGKVTKAIEDSVGLYIEAEFMTNPESEEACQAIELLKQGILKSMSIGGRWSYDAKVANNIVKCYIYEISLVGLPSNMLALVGQVEEKQTAQLQTKDVESKQEEIKEDLQELKEDIKELIKDTVELAEDVLEATEEAALPEATEAKPEQTQELTECDASEEDNKLKGVVTMDELQVKALIEAEMKKVNVNLNQGPKDTKVESHKAMENLLSAMMSKDIASANSISREIEEHNYSTKAVTRSDSAAAGGYAIPVEVMEEIIQLAYTKSIMVSNSNLVTVTGEQMTVPTMGAVTADYIADQTTAAGESNPTFAGPTIDMKRVGLFTPVSNTSMGQKASLMQSFIKGYATAFAKFLDYEMTIGNITNNSRLIDGLVFQANATRNGEINLSALSVAVLRAMKNQVTYMSNPADLIWVCNRRIADTITDLRTITGTGAEILAFPNSLEGRNVTPLGFPLVVNPLMTDVLNVSGDKATTGGESALILMDKTALIAAVSDMMRIETSAHNKFTYDQTVIRGIARVGWVLPLAGQVIVQPLTVAS